MNFNHFKILCIAAGVLLALALTGVLVRPPPGERAQHGGPDAAAGFYQGRHLRLIVPYDPGGGYDESARLVMPYLEKYTGARVDIINLPGAGGLRGANELYHSPPDGLTIGLLNGPALVTNQLAGIKGAAFRVEDFDYLGRITTDTRILVVSIRSGYASFDELRHAREAIRIGTSGLGASAYVDAVVSREAFGLNLDVIHGFDSSPAIRHAMLRGDVTGTWGSWGSAGEGVDAGLERILLQGGRRRVTGLEDVPTVFEMTGATADPARTESILNAWNALSAVGRAVAAPPGVPPVRLALLRNALRQAVQDPGFIAAAARAGRPIDYAPGDGMNAIIREATVMDPEIERLFVSIFKGEI